MRTLFLSAVALLAVFSGVMIFSGIKSNQKHSLGEIERFQQWRAKFGKLYSTPSEGEFRKDVVINKMRKVDAWNAEYDAQLRSKGLPALTEPMFVNMPWDDLTTEEFKKSKTGLNLDARQSDEIADPVDEVVIADEAVAAPSLGQTSSYVHKIRDQGECGSCWAFSTIATLERHYHKMRGTQIDLSHQELVDCSDYDYGCDGGWPTNTYNYISQYGIQSAASYPYYASQYYCERDETKRIWFDSTYQVNEVGFTTTRALNAAKLNIVAGTAVYSSNKFGNLAGGDTPYDASLSGECGYQVDHAVNIQTSGADSAGRTYVVIQNSWNIYWGNKGVKKIYPCGLSKLWGSTNIISHTTKATL